MNFKKVIIASVFLGSLNSFQNELCAQDKIQAAHPGVVYGNGRPDQQAGKNAAGTIYKDLALEKRESVTFKGQVLDVCPKKGCWMNVQLEDESVVFVKMKDYAFFVPADIKGKTVLMEGEAYKEMTSVDELRHYAKDAKKSQEEIEAITEAEEKFRFTANNILVIE